MSKPSRGFVVFSGYNSRAVIAFARAMAHQEVPFCLVARDGADEILRTRFANRVAAIRPDRSLDPQRLAALLDEVRERTGFGRLVLAPTTESLNRVFLEHRELFASGGVDVPLVAQKLYRELSDKLPFTELCRAHGIAVPAAIDDPRQAPLPFVAKPIAYDLVNPVAPMLICKEEERRAFVARPDMDRFFLQSYVGGRSLYLLLHVGLDQQVLSFSQENFIQQPHGKSIVAACPSDFHHSEEAARYVSMLLAVGFRGLAMIEVREHQGRFAMIECNPRMWGPSQLFVDAMGTNLFEAFARDHGFPCSVRPLLARTDCRYFWFGGLLDALQGNSSPTFHAYSARRLAAELPIWMENDIFRREDGLDLFADTFEAGR